MRLQPEDLANRLPPLSPSVSRFLERSSGESDDDQSLLNAIRFDPVLTARVLKHLNSGYYGLTSTIERVDRAVELFGLEAVKYVAITTSVVERFPASGAAIHITRQLWENGLAVGIVAKSLARETGVGTSALEGYFAAGLLSELGALTIAEADDKNYALLCSNSKSSLVPIEQLERQTYGTDRFLVGEAVAARWKLPPLLLEPAARKFDGRFANVVGVVHAARHAVAEAMQGTPEMPLPDSPHVLSEQSEIRRATADLVEKLTSAVPVIS